jgi:hypothetical protein
VVDPSAPAFGAFVAAAATRLALLRVLVVRRDAGAWQWT